MEELAAALGVTTLEQKYELLLNDFRSLVAYTNQLHAALEKSIGEPVVSADIKVAGGMGQRLTIQRNVTHMPSLAIRNTIRQPRALSVSESVQPRVLPTIQSTPQQ
jgi:hypothetical protein